MEIIYCYPFLPDSPWLFSRFMFTFHLHLLKNEHFFLLIIAKEFNSNPFNFFLFNYIELTVISINTPEFQTLIANDWTTWLDLV